MKTGKRLAALALGAVLALALAGTALAAEAAHSGTWQDYITKLGGGSWTLDGSGTLTFKGKGVIPPDEANGWAEWLAYKDSVERIVIGPGVTELTAHVFREFKNLKEVQIPETVTAVCDSAFYKCTGLTSVKIPASVLTVGEGAFSGCTSLETAEIAAGKIGVRAFAGCGSLSDVTLSEDVKSLGDGAFADCGLTALTLPASLESIGAGAVGNNPQLKSITAAAGNAVYRDVDGVVFSADKTTLALCPPGKEGTYSIPAGTKSIGDAAFYQCRSLTGVVVPEGAASIGDRAFFGCEALTDAALPGSLETVPNNMFGQCFKLGSVTLKDGVKRIEEGAFYFGRLRVIVLPESVGYIGTNAFAGGDSNTGVYYAGTREEWERIKTEGTPFDDSVSMHFESGGPAGPVFLSAEVGVSNQPSREDLTLVLTPKLNNAGAAGTVTVCAACYEGGRMAGFREARLLVEPGERTYQAVPLVFPGLAGKVERSKVFILSGGLCPTKILGQ